MAISFYYKFIMFYVGMVLLMVIVFLAQGAHADSVWRDGNGNVCLSEARPGQTCFHEYTAADTDSDPITVRGYADVCLNPDATTDGVAATAQIKVRQQMANVAVDKLNWIAIAGTTLTGIAGVDDCIYGISPNTRLFTDSTVAPGGQNTIVTLRVH